MEFSLQADKNLLTKISYRLLNRKFVYIFLH